MSCARAYVIAITFSLPAAIAITRFSHLFKSTVGYSLPQYLNLLRCRSVCELMMTSDRPIVDLAVSAGFNNTHTFYSAFKAHYHMTPREYILNRQNAPESRMDET